MKFTVLSLLICILSAEGFMSAQTTRRFAIPALSMADPGSITRGDTRGAALLVENVSVSRGDTQILTNVQWRVEPTAKWALVGQNGAG